MVGSNLEQGVQQVDETMQQLLGQHAWLQTLIWLAILIVASFVVNFLVRALLLRGSYRLLNMVKGGDNDFIRSAISRLANIAPALVFSVGVGVVPGLPAAATKIIENVTNAFIILTIALAISSMLSAFEDIYHRRQHLKMRSIKGLIQIVKVALFAVATILILATLIDRSPLILLSGLGAMAAVLMLVFQDTLLSLVASVQIASTDMVRVGDWITVSNLGADGTVIELALYTVKVQNFDNTITTVPIRKLVSDPFINWRGMQESGGRRIKRALFIDQSSIRFLTEEDKQHLSQYVLLRDYLDSKTKEITEWNGKLGDKAAIAANTRRMTNIGTFRAYITAYLKSHPGIHQKMTLMVRQLAPDANGLPLEIYCFTNTVVWAEYENTMSNIFDHLYSIIPEFGLQIFQSPSGKDWMHIVMERNTRNIDHVNTAKDNSYTAQ